MPFPKWAVEPVFLCRKPLPPDKSEPGNFYPITNAALVNCLRQLSSVANIADRIFDEIGCECRLLAERSERLRDKVNSCQEVVSNLNARAVQVPVSDLSETAKFLRKEKPFVTKYEQSTQLFLPSTRPPCIDRMYGAACATPVAVMCSIDRYRTDGLSSSELFMVTPVLGGTRMKRRKLLDIETRKPANFSLARIKQDPIESGSASLPPMVSSSRGYILKQNENLELERLPSPEEQAMLVSLEYPSTIVPVDTSGTGFTRMSLLRRSLIHIDFIIKRKKSKKKSKRRHTFCEGQNRELDQAIRNVTNTSCQTDDLDITSSSSTSLFRRSSLSKRRSRSVQDNSRRKNSCILDDLDLDSLKQDSKDSATEDDKEKTPTKVNSSTAKKSKTSSLRSRAYNFNPISSLSAAISIAAVKMRNSTRSGSKQDDGRSSSGNWSASSSTRASVDSDQHHVVVDGVSSPSRSSVGKDSVLSDATHQDPHNRSRDDILPIQSLTSSPVKKKKYTTVGLPWEANNSRTSKIPTPDFISLGASSTPLVRSPYASRRGVSDDGDSSVYSVDTDGYYTSMHTDSGLWCNALTTLKSEDVITDLVGLRQRKESQSSVSTNDSSINSFLSKSATECSSNSDSIKGPLCPQPPPRISSRKVGVDLDIKEIAPKPELELDDSDKSYSPHPPNGSASESEHEVRDRIRVKTAITPNRYPSMCAVSPETSDDEIADLKRRTVIPNVNVVIAEIHREDNLCDKVYKTDEQSLSRDKTDIVQEVPKPSSQSHSPNSPLSINMYRSETPVPSNFSSSIFHNQPVGTSTPRSGINITTFTPDFNETINPNTKGSSLESRNNLYDSNRIPTEITATEKPISPQPKSAKTLIPLKYAQRITVTPIARSDSSSNCTGTIKRTPLKQISSNESRADIASPLPCIKTDAASSYVSFKAPDSPVSSVASFRMGSEGQLSSPTGSLSRPVARVTLDPMGKVVYSSNSLERSNNVSPGKNNLDKRSYATLPLCQTDNVINRSTIPILTRSTTPVNTSSTTPVNTRSTTPVNTRSTTPVNTRSTTPVNTRCTTPVNTKSTTPVFNRCTTPMREVQNNSTKDSKVSAQIDGCDISLTKNSVKPSPAPSAQQQTPQYQFSSFKSPSAGNDFTFRPSRGGRFCRSYFPSHLISSPSAQTTSGGHQSTYSPSSSPVAVHVPQEQKNSSRSYDYSAGRNYQRSTSQIPSFKPNQTTNQNQSSNYVPNSQNDIKQGYNSSDKTIWPNRYHSSSTSNRYIVSNPKPQPASGIPYFSSDNSANIRTNPKSLTSLSPPDLIPSGQSPPSTLDITSSARTYNKSSLGDNKNSSRDTPDTSPHPLGSDKKNLKSLSANELFAIIHNSKKKHNIKTESEISMSPLSSRSVSPALSQTSLSKLQPVETGVLSRRYDNSPDRSRWCNSMPSNKKPMLQEKLGGTKPTSMHDFKMLLLQTRTGSQDSSPRPSAAELLKVSPPKTSSNSKLPVPSSTFKSPISHTVPNVMYSPGHGTVPMKRNMRTRSPYLTRYDSAYPPIIEDCSEEQESYEDSKYIASNNLPYKTQMLNKKHESSSQSSTPMTKATSTWV